VSGANKYVSVPEDESSLTFRIDGTDYVINPSAADVLRFQAALIALDDINQPDQYAVAVEAMLEYLTKPHADVVRALSSGRQFHVINELWDWYDRQLPKSPADPTSALSESPLAPESASPMSSDGLRDSSSPLSDPSPKSTPSVMSDSSQPLAPQEAMTLPS